MYSETWEAHAERLQLANHEREQAKLQAEAEAAFVREAATREREMAKVETESIEQLIDRVYGTTPSLPRTIAGGLIRGRKVDCVSELRFHLYERLKQYPGATSPTARALRRLWERLEEITRGEFSGEYPYDTEAKRKAKEETYER